ncbi:MAG: DUF1549 domain-containing protein, partial [Planctomycetota bacterium]|nr:DUF1549 domain-containing protein [Planctomycetota bacterium]
MDFARDIRPLFAARCFECHGPDKRRGGLRFDRSEDAFRRLRSGRFAIVPGDPGKSRLLELVQSDDEEEFMPPKGERLKPREIEALRRWIAGGAPWIEHWAFSAPERPPLPAVANRGWPRVPIDHFVLARLERESLSPSPEAPPSALVRRLSFDLTGLPPTPEEIREFLRDRRPDAFERLVERFLASPRYGERWARWWLDAARYADTNGYEKDRHRSIWRYRDWVIGALNEGMPFDRFTIEQVAGDMLPGATQDEIVATGFHRNTMVNEEGGIDVEEFRYESIVDRVNTTGTVFLGLTVGCAQCHNHKYDPISQREYYRFFAFLNNADEPEMDVRSEEIESRRLEIERRARRMERQLERRLSPEELAAKLAAWE